MMRRSFAALAGLLAPLALATAQTGRISGTVTDSAKIAVAGAQIMVVGTPFRGISNDAGRFTIPGVPVGS